MLSRYMDGSRIVYFNDSNGNLTIPGTLTASNIAGASFSLGPSVQVSSIECSSITAGSILNGSNTAFLSYTNTNAPVSDGIISGVSITALNQRVRPSLGEQQVFTNSTWTSRTAAANYGWRKVAWSPTLKLYCAISQSVRLDSIMTSPDGITWTLRNLPVALELGGIIWADTLGKFVAIGANSGGAASYSAVSTDGINWSTYVLPTSGYWLEMTWSSQLSRMVAVNYQGGTRSIAYSSDGVTWTTIHPNSPSTTNRWFGICWSAEVGLYVAVSPFADGGANRCVMTSPDGTTWTQRTAPATKDWYSVAWSPELKLFAAVSRTGDAAGVMTSSDGVNWTLQSTPAVGFTYITWIPELSMFATINETSALIVMSRNGITWTAYTVMPTAARYYGMVWSREQSKLVVMVDNSGLVVTSDVVFPASQNTLLFASPSYASVNNSNGLISMSSMNISSATVGVLSGATFISTSIGNVGNINITQANILTLSTNLISSAVTNASTINVNTISSAIASISTINVKTLVVDYVTVVSTALGNVATLNATNVSSAVVGTSTINVNTISSATGAFNTINATNVSSAVVGTSTLNVNTISSATGAFNTINTTNVSSAVVGTSTINVNTISSGTGAFNTINATNVSSAVVGTSTINVNTISSATGAFNTINATNVSSAVVGTSTINVNTISSAIMNTSTIKVNTISSLAITASSITTSSINGLTPRNATAGNIMYYDTSTKELTYGTAPAGTTISSFNSFSTGTASIGALNVSSIGGFSPIRVTDAIISNSTISASSIVSRTANIGTLQSDLLNIKGANTLVFVGGFNTTTDESNAWYSFNNESNFTAGSINAAANSIRYLNGRYYMGVEGTPTVSSIQYSSDGISWTRADTSLGNAQTVYDIKYGNNIYIASGAGPYTGFIQYSIDGLVWSNVISPAFPFAQPNGTFGGAFCAEYGNNVWLVGGGSWETNVSLYYSTDGSNFVNTTTGAFSNNGGDQGFTGTCFGLGFDGTKFIMTGADPLSNIGFRWSTNGINWSSAGFTGATFGSNVYVNCGNKIKYANGMWVAVGFATAPGGPVKYSYDGFSWSNGVGAQTANYKDLSWSGTKWYAAIAEASSSNAYQYSYDGINWSNGTAITNLTKANDGYAFAILARDTLEISTPTRMYISPAGNVGINTTNPLATLHVNGNTIVDGSLTASSIQTSSINGLTPRNATAGNIIYYDASTKELTYGTAPAGTTFSSFNSFSTGTASIGALNVSSIGGFSPITVTDAIISNSTISASTIVGSRGAISTLSVGNVDVSALNTRIRASQADQLRAVSTWVYQNSINTGYYWRAIAWSSKLGLFAAVGHNNSFEGTNYIMTSPDGVNWTLQSHALGMINCVIWSEEQAKFVAVGMDGTANATAYSWTSSDGITWNRYSTGAAKWNSYITVCYSPELNLYVAGAWLLNQLGSVLIYSSDGETWTQGPQPDLFQVFSIAWSKQLGIFVGVGSESPNAIYTSTDGITWTLSTYSFSQNWYHVTWSPELQLFIAVSRNTGTTTIIRSSDGINWVSCTNPDTSAGWTNVVWSPELSVFVVVAESGTTRIAYSFDGITFTGITSPIQRDYIGLAWSRELSIFVAASTDLSGSVVIRTVNPGLPASLNTIIANPAYLSYNNTTNVLTASSIQTSSINGLTLRNATAGNIIYYDASTKELTYGTAPAGGAAISSFNYFSTGTASIGALNVSSIGGFSPIRVTDAIISNSTISASSIVGSVGSISSLNVGNIDISALNTRVRASQADQLRAVSTWTNQNSISTSKNWRSIVWSPKLGLFAAVASQSDATDNIMTSPDGVNWTSRTHTSATLTSICWSEAQGKFVAIGYNGTNPYDYGGAGNACSVVSTDGITWTRYNTPNWNQYLCISYSPELSLYVAGAWFTPGSAPGANVIYSSDGQTWTEGQSPFQIFGVTWSKQLGIFVAVGGGNSIYRSSDGITWTAGSASDSHNWHAVTWSPELQLFIAVSRDTVTSSHIIRSSDGITWTACTSPDNTAGWTNVTWSPELSLFVVVGWTGSNRIAYSADGITFTGVIAPIAREYYAVCWSRELSIFVAASTETGGSVVMRTVNPGLPASLNTITANPAFLSYNNTTNVLTVAGDIATTGIVKLNGGVSAVKFTSAGTPTYSISRGEVTDNNNGFRVITTSDAIVKFFDVGFYTGNVAANANWQSKFKVDTASGNVNVSGALSKGSGSFKIDHPLPEKTDSHYLMHSFIEGPKADLIYRGKAILVDGHAVINIDQSAGMTEGTFVALCRDVQCFTTNESDWIPVRGKVDGNILTILAQDSTATSIISWMVIGERKDKHMYDTDWTDDNGHVIVEPLKIQLQSNV